MNGGDVKKKKKKKKMFSSMIPAAGFEGCEFRLTLARHLTPNSLPESQTCSRTIKLAAGDSSLSPRVS